MDMRTLYMKAGSARCIRPMRCSAWVRYKKSRGWCDLATSTRLSKTMVDVGRMNWVVYSGNIYTTRRWSNECHGSNLWVQPQRDRGDTNGHTP